METVKEKEIIKEPTTVKEPPTVKEQEAKQILIHNIKEWIKIDSELTHLKTEMKEKNKTKKNLTTTLVDVMRNNKIDCFDITGGSLIYKKNKVKKPINAKTLLKTLEQYYNTDKVVASELTNYILENRVIEIKETIKRKIK
jgi:hypothetical protein